MSDVPAYLPYPSDQGTTAYGPLFFGSSTCNTRYSYFGFGQKTPFALVPQADNQILGWAAGTELYYTNYSQGREKVDSVTIALTRNFESVSPGAHFFTGSFFADGIGGRYPDATVAANPWVLAYRETKTYMRTFKEEGSTPATSLTPIITWYTASELAALCDEHQYIDAWDPWVDNSTQPVGINVKVDKFIIRPENLYLNQGDQLRLITGPTISRNSLWQVNDAYAKIKTSVVESNLSFDYQRGEQFTI